MNKKLTNKIDQFHMHEILDRSSIVAKMIEAFIIDHPALNTKMEKTAEKALDLIWDIYIMAGEESSKNKEK